MSVTACRDINRFDGMIIKFWRSKKFKLKSVEASARLSRTSRRRGGAVINSYNRYSATSAIALLGHHLRGVVLAPILSST
jgi:hypothetical protein